MINLDAARMVSYALLFDDCIMGTSTSSFKIYESSRRIAIGRQCQEIFNSRPYSPHMQSVLCLSPHSSEYLLSDASFFFHGSKLLKVLDLESIETQGGFPREIEQLVLLKYFAIRGMFNSIPSSVRKLTNLETFIVIAPLTNIPDVILDMSKLRHLRLDQAFFFAPRVSTESLSKHKEFELDSMQTLKTVSICNLEAEEVMRCFPNLQELKCEICEFKTDDSGSRFPALDFLHHLETLSVSFAHGSQRQIVNSLKLIFPSSVRKLTLSELCLPWKEMSAVGRLLQNLQVLKLLNGSFVGEEWDMDSDQVEFPRLKLLKLCKMDIKKWTVNSSSKFPMLQKLAVLDCHKLEEIPTVFSQIVSLQQIEMKNCTALELQWSMQTVTFN